MPRIALAAVAALVLAAAGCGGNDSGGGGGSSDKAATPKEAFATSCGGCHTLKAARTEGQVGPNLDELRPDAATVKKAIDTGPSVMPAGLLKGAAGGRGRDVRGRERRSLNAGVRTTGARRSDGAYVAPPCGWVILWCSAALCSLAVAPQAQAAFPWTYDGTVPNDLTRKTVWMYASTAEPGSPVAGDARELHGVRGAHLVDAADVPQGWRITTGRPDVTIAVLDSGIKWDDDGAMQDLRFKVRISRGEAHEPRSDRTTATVDGVDCARYGDSGWDRDGNGVFDLRDYACDSRVAKDPPHGVNPDLLDPQDVLIAFSDGVDDDGNGRPDDIVGWDFVDDDNDPYDDVQYGHGTGEARDSTAEAGNGGDLGAWPELHGPAAAGRHLVRRRRQPVRAGDAVRDRQRGARRPGGARHAEQVAPGR